MINRIEGFFDDRYKKEIPPSFEGGLLGDGEIEDIIDRNIITIENLELDSMMVRRAVMEGVSGELKCITPTIYVRCYCPELNRTEMFVIPVLAGFNEESEKAQIIKQIARELFDRRRVPIAVTISTEAWMAAVPENTQDGWRPRDSECRVEVSLVLSETPEGLTVVFGAEITRDAESNILIGEFAEYYSGKTQGQSIVSTLYIEYARMGLAMIAKKISEQDNSDIDLNDLVDGMGDGE